jgi:hypothetical protein
MIEGQRSGKSIAADIINNPDMASYYSFTQAGFMLVSLVYIGAFLVMLRKGIQGSAISSSKKTTVFNGVLISVVLWTLVISVMSYLQIFNDFSSLPPKFFIVVIIPLITIIWAVSRPTTNEILRHISPHQIIFLQSFRVFVEVLLWMLFVDNLLPVQMTFEGYNFDILAGLTAPFIGWFLRRNASARVMIIWNILCLMLLINIVTIAILSTPVPFRVFMNEPANTIVTQFPVVWLPGLLVPLAYTLHILSLKQASMMTKGFELPVSPGT